MSQRSPKRPRRASLPGAFAGFVAGAVLAGALVPLVGAEREVTAAASGAPGFLSDATGQAQGEGPGGPASVIPGAAAGVPSAADAPAPSAISSGGAGPAAPGVQGPSNTDAGAAGPSGSGNRSTDVGVTATTIKIGVLSANCRACDSIGFLATKNAGRMAQAFAADLNRRGGVHGRKLEVVVAEYDPVSDQVQKTNTDRAACVQLTEGHRVFAAIVPFANAATRTACYYQEHRTPTLALGPNAEFHDPNTFNKNDGRLFSMTPSSARQLTAWGAGLASAGHLKNRPFGIVTDTTTDSATREYMLAELKRRGYEPRRVSTMPTDPAAFSSKSQTEQVAMRREGIETVLFLINPIFMQIWIQQAESSGWRPQYHLSDFPNFASDSFGSEQPESFKNAIALSYLPQADSARSAADARCFKIWESAIGGPTDSADVKTYALHTVCNLFLMLERGAKNAGPNLTKVTLAQGLSRVGPLGLSGVVTGAGKLGGPYGFGSVKFTAVDYLNWKTWQGGRYVTTGRPFKMPV